jgi:hypothetical protein
MEGMHCILSGVVSPVAHAWPEEEAIFCRDCQQVKHHDHASEEEENDREGCVRASVGCTEVCLCGSEREEVAGSFHPS